MIEAIIFFAAMWFSIGYIVSLIGSVVNKKPSTKTDAIIGFIATLLWSVLFYLLH